MAGHTGDVDTARRGLADPSPAVRASALSAMVRLEALTHPDLHRALDDEADPVRSRACELAALLTGADEASGPGAGRSSELIDHELIEHELIEHELIEHELIEHLCTRTGDASDSVAESACFALGELGTVAGGPPAVGILASVAGAHGDPLVREAAVAALGAIGDPDGLPAILAATTDKPAVRRRAVLALAPFDGPDVDAALERARTDRDWQVRQAAEDLTGA